MRRTQHDGMFLICLVFNMVLNWTGAIPCLILLALHFLFGISLLWAAAAFSIWILWIILWMCFIGWTAKVGSEPTPQRENKNPYSHKNKNI